MATQHNLPPVVAGPPLLPAKVGRKRGTTVQDPHLTDKPVRPEPQSERKKIRDRSRSPRQDSRSSSPIVPADDFSSMDASNQPALYTFLLTNFDVKYQQPKLLVTQIHKYQPRLIIQQIIPTRNGVLIKTPDPHFARTIRDKNSFEIFGPTAQLTALTSSKLKTTPPPRKQPMLSVVIRGVELDLTADDIEGELREEGHNIHKCIRIKGDHGPTFMVRVLSTDHTAINQLLAEGAYIYRKKYRVEPSKTSTPLPIRCERCQAYNTHTTNNCRNPLRCGYCSGPHLTRTCTNLAQPPSCATCNDQHPTYSSKCRSRPRPSEAKPEHVVPLRTYPTSSPTATATAPTGTDPPLPVVTLDKLLEFLTLAMQNIHPFLRPHIYTQIQFAAKTVFHVNFSATYSGTYVHFHTAPALGLETTV